MNTTTTRRPRLGLVAGVLAVAIASSSGAYAAGAMITSSNQLKNGVVNTGDIKNGTVRVKDLNQKTVDALNPAPVSIEAWHNFDTAGNPGLAGDWAVFPGIEYQKPGFRKNADGLVTVRGAVTRLNNFAADTEIATLPTGYRPSACQVFSLATFDGLGGQDPEGAVEICPDGGIKMYSDGDDRFVALDGISFYVS